MTSPEKAPLVYDAGSHQLVAEGVGPIVESPAPETIDVSRLPGARMVALAKMEDGGAVAFAGCARGSSARFAPGLEGVLFGRGRDLSMASLGVPAREVVIERESSDAQRFEQVVVGRTDRGPLRVHQVLTFAGPDRDVLLCSLACAGPGCDRSVLAVEGQPPDVPPPNIALRAFFAAASHPRATAVGGALVIVACAALILARRPRPRPS